jgi:hypothetical protein
MLRSRVVRFSVVVLIGAIVAAATVFTRGVHSRLDAVGARAQVVQYRIARLEVLSAELAGALSGAPASMPSADRLARAAALARRLAAEAERVERLPSQLEPLPSVERIIATASGVDAALERVDGYLGEGADLMAADVLRGDVAQATQTLTRHVRGLRPDADLALGRAMAPLNERALTALYGAAGGTGLALLLLAWLPGRVRAAAGVATAEAAPRESGALPAMPCPGPDLPALADLCRAIGTATSSNALPDFLARTAALLGAARVILWVRTGDHLIPVASHGYTPAVLRSLGQVPLRETTPLTAAWGGDQPVVLPASEGSPEALVAPLHAPGGCLGALTAESTAGAAFAPSAISVAAVVASQLAAALPAPADGESRDGQGRTSDGDTAGGPPLTLDAASA